MSTIEIILGLLSTILTALGVNMIKEYFAYRKYLAEIKKIQDAQDTKMIELKKEEDERREKHQIWFDQRMASLENKFGELSSVVRGHINDSTFEIDFKNDFQNFVRGICRSNVTMDKDFINAFQTYSKYIEDYAINFYKDSYRNSMKSEFTKQKLASNLQDDMNKIIGSFQNFLHLSEIGGVKVWKNSEYTFGKFVKDGKNVNIHACGLALVQILEQNGLDTYEKFLSVFTNHINRWFSNFSTAIQLWDNIQKT
jgi:hypothetical protein